MDKRRNLKRAVARIAALDRTYPRAMGLAGGLVGIGLANVVIATGISDPEGRAMAVGLLIVGGAAYSAVLLMTGPEGKGRR
jgi:hypothetical protein